MLPQVEAHHQVLLMLSVLVRFEPVPTVGRPHMSKVPVPMNNVGAAVITPIGQGHTPLLCIKINLAAPGHVLHEAEERCRT